MSLRETNRFARAIDLVVEAAERGAFRVALIGGFALPFFGVMRATADVDFLSDESGSGELDAALRAAGLRCLQRTRELASYESPEPRQVASVDLLFARRPRARAILERASWRPMGDGGRNVPVVDPEGLIGLKVQSVATNPDRALRDRDDIRQVLKVHGARLDLDLVREYYRVFGMEDEVVVLLNDLGIPRR